MYGFNDDYYALADAGSLTIYHNASEGTVSKAFSETTNSNIVLTDSSHK